MISKHRELFIFICMLLIVPLAGEPRIHPFGNEFSSFRVSFGSPMFLLFLLWLRNVPMAVSGLAVGIAVVLFRGALDAIGGAPLSTGVYQHIPTFFYYFPYAICFSCMKLNRAPITTQAMKIAFWAIIAEVIASIAELYTMDLFLGTQAAIITVPVLARLTGIAFLRCFFILSFFFLSQLYLTEIHLAHELHEKNRLTMMIANIYEAVFELRQALHKAETATHDCYGIYEDLRSLHDPAELTRITQEALRVAGEVHDIKKDNQRIYAALSEMTSQNNSHKLNDYLSPAEICRLIVHAQKKYARQLDKRIEFSTDVSARLPELHAYTILSILNNLTANAIEAIHERGSIAISMKRMGSDLHLDVTNTGSSIPLRRLRQIFRPGYTTKYDSDGRASSGVGLTYVKSLAEHLGGIGRQGQCDVPHRAAAQQPDDAPNSQPASRREGRRRIISTERTAIMNIMLIDDDEAIRDMLQDIIEDYELGTVVASLPSAANITTAELIARHIDLLLIDMLMPDCDGIASVRRFQDFPGKIIMISQVNSKDLIGKAYESGIYAYITKPLNRNEIISVMRSVEEYIRLERFAHTLQSTLQTTLNPDIAMMQQKEVTPQQKAASLLKDLGVAGSAGYDDLIEIIAYLQAHNKGSAIPSLKTIFTAVAEQHAAENVQKEAKTIEQRLRRAVFQAMVSTASMGVVDYTNPKFEEYAPFYFDYAEVCSIMRMIQQNEKPQISKVHINTKKFIQALYTASQEA